jgi:hypothetical protein
MKLRFANCYSFTLFSQCQNKRLSVCQLNIEIHWRNVEEIRQMTQMFIKNQFYLVMIEYNPYSVSGQCICYEYVFIHSDCLKKYNTLPLL